METTSQETRASTKIFIEEKIYKFQLNNESQSHVTFLAEIV